MAPYPQGMTYALISLDHADLVGEFGSEQEALAALDRVIAGDATAAAELGVVAFDDEGIPIGEPITRTLAR